MFLPSDGCGRAQITAQQACDDDGGNTDKPTHRFPIHLTNPLSPDIEPRSPDLPMPFFPLNESVSPLMRRGLSWLTTGYGRGAFPMGSLTHSLDGLQTVGELP